VARTDYPELQPLFDVMELYEKEGFFVSMFKGNEEKHGTDFIFMEITALSEGSWDFIKDGIYNIKFLDMYENAIEYSIKQSSSEKTIYVFIFFRTNVINCAFGLSGYTKECDNLCNKNNKCKVEYGKYSIKLKFFESIEKCVDIMRVYEFKLRFRDITKAYQYLRVMKETLFPKSKNIESELKPDNI
jgi:hypothetical protein